MTTSLTKREEQKLLKEIEPYLHKLVATEFRSAGLDHEDLVQEAMIASLRAIREWDASKGASVRTFAVFCARNDLLKIVRDNNRAKRKARTVSLDTPVYGDDSPDTLHDIIGCAPNQEIALIQRERAQRIKSLIGNLPIEQMQVLLMRNAEEEPTLEKVAGALKITKRRAHYVESKALAKLRKGLKDVA